MKYSADIMYMSQRGLSEDRQISIEQLGQHLFKVLQYPEHYVAGYEVAGYVESLETALQALWGFPYDPSKFTYQYRITGCTCDDIGEGMIRMDGKCPYHLKLKGDVHGVC